jgi:hypothetical protein
MSIEYSPGGDVYEDSILTVNENGEEVYVPLSEIKELKADPYHWGDSMTVQFDDKGDDDE